MVDQNQIPLFRQDQLLRVLCALPSGGGTQSPIVSFCPVGATNAHCSTEPIKSCKVAMFWLDLFLLVLGGIFPSSTLWVPWGTLWRRKAGQMLVAFPIFFFLAVPEVYRSSQARHRTHDNTGLVTHFEMEGTPLFMSWDRLSFLVLNNILWHGCTTVYSLIHQLKNLMVTPPSFGNYESCYYKHLCTGFYMDIIFKFFWINQVWLLDYRVRICLVL